MTNLTTVQVQSESKIKKIGQNWVYGEDLRSLTPKTKKWGNNHLSRRFGKYSFDFIKVLKSLFCIVVITLVICHVYINDFLRVFPGEMTKVGTKVRPIRR